MESYSLAEKWEYVYYLDTGNITQNKIDLIQHMVQREMAKRGKGKKYHSGVHAFSSKIKCGECGSWYGSKVWHSNSKYRKIIWQCNHRFDGDCRCQTPHLTDEEIQLHFLAAANKLLATKAAVIANGRELQALLFDTTELKAEQAQLLEETQAVSDMVQQAIQENARTALNQTEYQKCYGWLKEFCERNDFPFYGIHQFRHLHTSLLIGAGIDPTTVSGILGHSQVSTTLNLYSHMFRENQIKACDAVANALSFTSKEPEETKNPHHTNDTESYEKIG